MYKRLAFFAYYKCSSNAYQPPVSWSATRSGSNWSYSHEKVMHSMGAFNPKERQGALLVLTKMGTLRLMYQGPNGQYVEKTQELEAQNLTADFCISHAAFAPSRGSNISLIFEAPSLTLYRAASITSNIRQLSSHARLSISYCMESTRSAGRCPKGNNFSDSRCITFSTGGRLLTTAYQF